MNMAEKHVYSQKGVATEVKDDIQLEWNRKCLSFARTELNMIRLTAVRIKQNVFTICQEITKNPEDENGLLREEESMKTMQMDVTKQKLF